MATDIFADDIEDLGQQPLPNTEATANPVEFVTPSQPMQQVKTQFVTAVAVQIPRDMKRVKADVLTEASELGEAAYYGWGEGRDHVEGPSHELAVTALRIYGNCAVEQGEVKETPTAFFYDVAIVDYERGFTIRRPFRQSKRWNVAGKMDDERKMDIRFQIGASKAVRNVALEFLPSSLIDSAMQAAKKGMRARLDAWVKRHGIAKAQERILSEFKKLGVTEERVLEKYKLGKVKDITIDTLVSLRGDLRALQDGEESAAVLFPDPNKKEEEKEPAATEEPTSQADKVKQAFANQEEEQGQQTEQAETASQAVPEEQAEADNQTVNEEQIGQLLKMGTDNGITEIALSKYCQKAYQRTLDRLTVGEARSIYTSIQDGSLTQWLKANSVEEDETEKKKPKNSKNK